MRLYFISRYFPNSLINMIDIMIGRAIVLYDVDKKRVKTFLLKQ